MNDAQFVRQYAILLAFVVSLLLVFHFIPVFRPYDELNIVAFIFFNALCIGAYYFGKRSLQSSNKFLFNQLIVLNVIVKMGVSIAIIIVFRKLFNPDTNWFVLSFLILYLIYTIFETYLLTALVKMHS
jgi:hypothetical protein